MFQFFNKVSTDLLIYDDVFPSEFSPFRYTEYMAYLNHFKHVHILCSGKSLKCFPNSPSIKKLLKQFKKLFPQHESKVSLYNSIKKINTKLIYVTFIANAQRLKLSTLKIPFIVQVYPGGGLKLNNPFLDAEMKQIFNSIYCKKIIVTQRHFYNYIIEHSLCPKEKIEFIFGVVTPFSSLENPIVEKKYFGIDKNTLDICFTAHKYMPQGKDKGYDIFIESAKYLAKKYDFIRFHVVGDYSASDISISGLEEKIYFHGIQKKEWFYSFYKNIDILLSPNRPFIISEGAFDGFPTASATEAGLQGVSLFVSDELEENQSIFEDGKEIVIVKPNVDDIIQKIETLLSNPIKLKEIGFSGALKIKQLYSIQNQITPRIKIIEKELEKLL